MRVGDRVEYVAERGARPAPGTVAACYGVWVDVRLDDGSFVEQAFAATHHFQSPRGNYCVAAQIVNPVT